MTTTVIIALVNVILLISAYLFGAGKASGKANEQITTVIDEIKELKSSVKDDLGAAKKSFETEIKATKEFLAFRITSLEAEQKKSNGIKERLVAVEQSAKSAHHRIDGIENRN
jgi:hypothetical protein